MDKENFYELGKELLDFDRLVLGQEHSGNSQDILDRSLKNMERRDELAKIFSSEKLFSLSK